MKLIVMTKSTFFVEEDKILQALFDGGLENLHLYKPGWEPVYSERLLTLLPEEYYKKITVHDHFYLKEEYRLRGIHLDRPDQQAPKGYKGKLSRTCRRLEDLKQIAGGELTDSNKRSLWSWCVYWKNEKHMSLLDVLSSMNLSAEQADYIMRRRAEQEAREATQ